MHGFALCQARAWWRTRQPHRVERAVMKSGSTSGERMVDRRQRFGRLLPPRGGAFAFGVVRQMRVEQKVGADRR